MGVAGDVRWLGHVDRDALPAVYPSADVCVHLHAGARRPGPDVLEAMACGVPEQIGGVRVFGCHELVVHGLAKTGYPARAYTLLAP